MNKTVDVEKVANEILEVLNRNNISYDAMEYVFECTKKVAHSNTVAYPSLLSRNANPSAAELATAVDVEKIIEEINSRLSAIIPPPEAFYGTHQSRE
ncbi:hypothetical protein WJ0W_003533 [Paenibacillus melissococcoides]|uniref:Competence protein ComFB n=1 Tax=Paenibacillus melissococcoides TaxID=2912268 RepID=A0ABM9G3N5_9BACL|nr:MULTISPECIES: hypothetical protein [Paenibacillus]GIO82263.1 hypothetical protein J6TS7_58730 [Paenibacillus dendritiformis]CAH8246298.1 hypothetical protein WJ0W_003533 [Paenibacillus melissococcoides]CAH8713549.1 hypothetical protein WDD9_003605 [Paenibacillus melissococcoides]CAH8714283.1 hypothetical protein HTL2_003908 [Paenibacillus melissococcoides]